MQVAKVCIVGCFAVSRSARIGLIVLALAIAVVGAGAVGMAFLPAAVTEPVVKPVTQSVELLTGDDKLETITVDFDEQPAVLGISNYPRIQLGAMRYTTDTSLIDRASELLKGKTFTLKNGVKILQGTIKLNPVNNYCKTRQEVKKVVEVNPLFSL